MLLARSMQQEAGTVPAAAVCLWCSGLLEGLLIRPWKRSEIETVHPETQRMSEPLQQAGYTSEVCIQTGSLI